MAQAVFDDHPLEQYLTDAGDTPEIVLPGGSAEFVLAQEEYTNELPYIVLKALERLQSVLSSLHTLKQRISQPNVFAERFKYDVVSSSLLSTSLSPSRPQGSSHQSIPGRLKLSYEEHNRHGSDDTQSVSSHATPQLHQTNRGMAHLGPLSITLILGAAIFSAGYVFLGMLMLSGTIYYAHVHDLSEDQKSDIMLMSLSSLSDLISAGDTWNSIVHEAVSCLETEEQRPFFNPSSPSSPSSSLRVALQSSLYTMQTQCDNVRQLFAALVSHADLPQLVEMYAPASPPTTRMSLSESIGSRPASLTRSSSSSSHVHNHTMSSPGDIKRLSWTGSYARVGSRSARLALSPREKHRSSPLLTAPSPPSPSLSPIKKSRKLRLSLSRSAPTTPSSQTLDDVREEDNGVDKKSCSERDELSWGQSALQMRQQQRDSGLDSLGLSPPPSYFTAVSPVASSSHPVSPTPSSHTRASSRFTSLQASRHPLSLPALHQALQGALSSKRYACAHLLALRFDEQDDEGYWEDVRAVIDLLTSAFIDASGRLSEALDAVAQMRLKDEKPTPGHSRVPSAALDPAALELSAAPPARSLAEMISYAPMPSHLSRFAVHVDNISSALNTARDTLEQCATALRDGAQPEDSRETDVLFSESPALQAYEQLRRELGVALRECERGRERLLDVLKPAAPASHPDEADPQDVPALAHDASGDVTPESASPLLHDFARPGDDGARAEAYSSFAPRALGDALDDATPHLLLTASAQHLPPPGIEQVFEADTGAAPSFARERAKLPREERIRLAREQRRESGGLGLSLAQDEPKSKVERWGPGMEVVQELKDVIWQVGERRRKMMASQTRTPVPSEDIMSEESPLS